MSRLFLLLPVVLLFSCAAPSAVTHVQADDEFVDEAYCLVELAYKARILKTPNYRTPDNTLAKCDKGETMYVIGYEKGMAKVSYNGQTGYVSDQYFRYNLYYDAWKTGYFVKMSDQSAEEDLAHKASE